MVMNREEYVAGMRSKENRDIFLRKEKREETTRKT
jgi:hypothetical protein